MKNTATATILNGMTKDNPLRKGESKGRGRPRKAIGSTFNVGTSLGEVKVRFAREDGKETIISLSPEACVALSDAINGAAPAARKQAVALKAVADAQAALAAVQDGVPLEEKPKAAPKAVKEKPSPAVKSKKSPKAKGKSAPKASAKKKGAAAKKK